MRKVAAVFIVLLATAAMTTGAAFGAAHGTNRPFKGSGTGTDTVPVIGGSVFIIDGTLHATLLGAGTFHGEGTQNGPTSFTHNLTIVAANGDELTAFANGTDTGPTTFTEVDTITGGTGRFFGASGTFTVTTNTTVVPVPPNNIAFDFTGTISY